MKTLADDETIIERMSLLCSIYACDRAAEKAALELPHVNTTQCNKLFLDTWAVFRHVTTEMGKLRMLEQGLRVRQSDPLEAFVHGKEIPAHLRWAETEAFLRSGNWNVRKT